MSLYLQIKYGRLVGATLELAKVRSDSPLHINARCPVCGDSAKIKTKTRFHIREHQGTVFCSCFNCGLSTNLVGFMKLYATALYSEYTFERYKDLGSKNEPVITCAPTPEPAKVHKLDLPYVKDLPADHPARKYVESRRLPSYPFQFTDKFYTFSSKYNHELEAVNKSIRKSDESRLIIPFFDKSGNVFAYQGRDLMGVSNQKYITITINPKVPKIFGIDRVDFKQQISIVEGPIDSLFLRNSLASVNASLIATASKLERAINKELLTLVYDNEPRNKIIVDHYQDAVSKGYNIVIWPKTCDGIKDINDLILCGKDPQKIIDSNTYRGLSAQIALNNWKKT